MSRAFTKEADNETPQPTPERAVMGGPNPVTRGGARLIMEALREIDAKLKNADDERLQRDRRYWLSRQATMEQIAPHRSPDRVSFGTFVTIRRRGRESQVQIVGQDEADPTQNLISWTSPLARAIDGAAIGETVELELGVRVEAISILGIRGDED